MNELTAKENKLHQTPMEVLLGIDENGMTDARKLYEFLQLAKGQFSRWAKTSIENNEFAVESEDYEGFDIDVEGNKCLNYKLSSRFAKKLALQAHNEKGEEARNYYVSVEENSHKLIASLSGLSPELQHLISVELRLNKAEEENRRTNERIDDIRNVVALNPVEWRKDTNGIINRIATNMGGNEHIASIHKEAYTLLEERYGVLLQTRLTNKRRRMAEEGLCKSKRDRLNQLDVIAEDKKLIEGYVSIVKELAIKYGVGA